MELNVDALQAKALELRKENLQFAQKANAEINMINQQVKAMAEQSQAKLKEAQRHVDIMDGRIVSLEDLIREMGGTPKDLDGNPIAGNPPEIKALPAPEAVANEAPATTD